MMQREFRLFLTALSFYTRIPVPAVIHQESQQLLPDAIRYLPVVGWISGGLAALVYWVCNYLFDHTLAVLFAMVATVLLTGAFHEDGFADVCDGFGGGWNKQKILEIMKDSRIGAYGVTGLILLLAIRFAVLSSLLKPHFSPLFTAGILILGHSFSRFTAISLTFQYPYARNENSKAGHALEQTRLVNLFAALFFALIPLVVLMVYTTSFLVGLIIIPALLISYGLGRWFNKWIGGYTGDCLGAVQQLTEVVIYLSIILIWKFI